MPMSFGGRVVSSSECVTRPKGQEIGSTSYAGPTQRSLLIGPYAVRRGSAMNAGLLWGAYHFLRPGSIPAQVDFFLKIAAPDNATLLALDHEDGRVPLIRLAAGQCCIPGSS